jgi:hypothetical protein
MRLSPVALYLESCGIPLIAPHKLLPDAVEWVVSVFDVPTLRVILLLGCFLAPMFYGGRKLHDDHNPVYRSFGLYEMSYSYAITIS